MTAETLSFKTELKQLLHLIIHSLYSHKDIFLRELISNASDAVDAVRFQGLTSADLLEDNADWKIKLIPNKDQRTLTISDNGIGMTKETISENLGTIAKSGTREFLEQLKSAQAQDRPDLIGQFGVGFYSSFMVADKVTVISRRGGSTPEHGVRWESDGQGEFTIEDVTKEQRGTDVILHLREDEQEFLEPHRLRQLVKKYSDFVEHPIVMDVETEAEDKEKRVEEETLNSRKAIWLRSKSEVSPEEYNEFYRHLTHDPQEPLKTIHYAAEGTLEFKAILFIPGHRPFELMWGDSKKGLHLYIQRVFIMDDCETMLPLYLRFVRGVVDSPDLPLNVSRELLQQSAPLEKIKSNLTGKILSSLEEMKRKDHEDYLKFYDEMGVFLKEGVSQDWANREKLADLLLFESTKTAKGKYTSLAEYAERMGNQNEIFFLTGESRDLMEQSPYLESFRDQGTEVLLLTEPIDEFVVQALREYKGNKLQAVDKTGLDQGSIDEEKKKQLQPLLDFLKEKLPDIKEARLSQRLKESPVCLVADELDMSANMERLMQKLAKDQPPPSAQRILEINADHPAIQAIDQLRAKNQDDPRLESYARLLYDQAVIAEGSKVKDPLDFSKRINELLIKDAEINS